MREPPTKYLVIQETQNVLGFMSWQVDMEENEAIIYWYDVFSPR